VKGYINEAALKRAPHPCTVSSLALFVAYALGSANLARLTKYNLYEKSKF